MASHVFSVVLVTDRPPLDDFWTTLTDVHIMKQVNGPELIKHGAVKLDSLMYPVMDDSIEFFVDGKVMPC